MKKNEIKLPPIISDNMVIQAGKAVHLWGWARPHEVITVRLAGVEFRGKADRKGRFSITVGPLKPGGPHTLVIGGREKVHIENVLVGEVWLCSGQSNMEMPVSQVFNAGQESASAHYPEIRVFKTPHMISPVPESTTPGRWVVCSPETVGTFTAAGYFFARDILKNTGRPVGLIDASWGGTRIEPWIGLEGFQTWTGFPAMKVKFRREIAAIAPWKLPIGPNCLEPVHLDVGNTGFDRGWHLAKATPGEWRPIRVPGYWHTHGLRFVGAVWFRKTVTIPESWNQQDVYLSLGPLVDFDETYVNGEKVGSIGKEVPNFWNVGRRYVVPGNRLRPGRNVITVRIFAHRIVGGFGGQPEDLYLRVINKPELGTISLRRGWTYRVERKLEPFSNPESATVPTTIYNAMIHGLAGCGLAGFLWYQGESNAGEPDAYRELIRILIRDWRRRWGQGDLPFLVVQLANYALPGPAMRWPELREAQSLALREPNTGLVVAVDVGESNDIHPKNKQAVGRRLALLALNKVYGKRVSCISPMYKGMSVEGGRIRVSFEHDGGGLCLSRSKGLTGFEIAGADLQFLPAQVSIRGDGVVVWNREVKAPVAVRYAWRNDPVCGLYSKAGLPAMPFRTDLQDDAGGCKEDG